MSDQPSFAVAWLRQRELGAVAVAAIEEDELRKLDDDTALRMADALLAATPREAIEPSRHTSSGLVEQQRLFSRARR
jgi:hypothetical protein